MLKFGGVLTINDFLHSLGASADKLLLGKLFTANTVGLYTRAQSLMLQPLMQLMPPLQNVILPVMSRLAKEPQKLRSMFLDLLRVASFACSFMTVYLVAGADWLVWTFLGSKWMEAADILRLLAAPAFVIPLNALCAASLIAQGKSTALIRWGFTKNTLIVMAVLAGLPWGAKGVAASLSICSFCLLWPLLNYVTAKAGPANSKDIWSAVAPGSGACVLTCVVLLFVRIAFGLRNPISGLLVLFIANLLIHGLIMITFPPGKRALRSLLNVVLSFRVA